VTAKKGDGYIRWRCKSCGQKLKVKETYEGGNVIKCPRCGALVNVPMGNIGAIAEASDMEETGDPGQLRLDAEKLLERLEGRAAKADGPGSAGSTPSLRRGPWSAAAAFARTEELDQLASAITKIDQETMGEVQQLYKQADMKPGQRAQEMEAIARGRKERLLKLLKARLSTVKDKLTPLEDAHERLTGQQLNELERLRRVQEAMRFYGRYVLAIDV
jgi:DNA-directed RNA polymerase subunit RPC12/RpoP